MQGFVQFFDMESNRGIHCICIASRGKDRISSRWLVNNMAPPMAAREAILVLSGD